MFAKSPIQDGLYGVNLLKMPAVQALDAVQYC